MNLAEVGLTFFSQAISRTLIFCVVLPVGSNQCRLEGLSVDKQTAVQQRSTALKPLVQVSDQSVPKQQQRGWWVFSSRGAGSSCFPFTVTGQTPTFMRHSMTFLPWRLSENICHGRVFKIQCLEIECRRKDSVQGFIWCLWEWDMRSSAEKCEPCCGSQMQLLVQLSTFDLSTDKGT